MIYEDKEIGFKHGDWLTSQFLNKRKWFRFRCGPVSIYPYSLNRFYYPKAYGSLRFPRTFRSIKWAHAHELEGIKVRYNGNKNLPTAWDDQFGHNEKNWKRHRKTQYKY